MIFLPHPSVTARVRIRPLRNHEVYDDEFWCVKFMIPTGGILQFNIFRSSIDQLQLDQAAKRSFQSLNTVRIYYKNPTVIRLAKIISI